jgi:competence protein ComEC
LRFNPINLLIKSVLHREKKVETPLIAKLLVPLIFGVLVGYYFLVQLEFSLLIFFCFLLFFLAVPIISRVLKFRAVFGLVSTCYFFLLGMLLVQLHTSNLNEFYFCNNKQETAIYQIRLLEQPIEKENSYKSLAAVQKRNDTVTVGETLVYFQKDKHAQNLMYGDVLLIEGQFKVIETDKNPYEFDYARYLRQQNIHHQTYLKSDQYMKVGRDKRYLVNTVFSLRSKLEKKLSNSGMNPDNITVAKALLLGDKNDLDQTTQRTFSGAGAMHVLAVSGLHVGIVMLFISFFLKPLKQIPFGQELFVILVLLSIWLYAFLTGMSSSVLRAAIMFSFVVIGRELQRETSIYQSIAVSAFLLIILEPLVIFQVGFQLSYLAVIGIVYLQPRLYQLWFIRWKLADYFWQLTTVSIAAQLATFPLSLYYFHQFPNYFLISNLFVIPLAFAILIVGIAYFFFSAIPWLGEFFMTILNLLLTWMNEGVKWIGILPNSVYEGISLYWYEALWIYSCLILLLLGFHLRKKSVLFACFGGVILLLIFNLMKQHQMKNSNEFIIYNSEKHVAVELCFGRQNQFFASAQLLRDTEALNYVAQSNWIYRVGQTKPTKTYEIDTLSGPLFFGKKSCLFLHKKNYLKYQSKMEQVDFYYIDGLSFMPEEQISMLTATDGMIILGRNNSFRFKKYIHSKLPAKRIYDLQREGAFRVFF